LSESLEEERLRDERDELEELDLEEAEEEDEEEETAAAAEEEEDDGTDDNAELCSDFEGDEDEGSAASCFCTSAVYSAATA
jgi:hypothetical protein